MIRLIQYKRKMSIQQNDYFIEKMKDLLYLTEILTPKFSGTYVIVFFDPTLAECKELIDENILPEFIDCYLYLNKQKLDKLLLDYPKLVPKQKSAWETYQEMISSMTNIISSTAAKMLYKAIGANETALEEALSKLDAECTTGTITPKDVQKNFMYTPRVYASDVLDAFLMQSKNRWTLFEKYYKDCGDEVAYYALKKQVKAALSDKVAYLNNEDVKRKNLGRIDAPYFCYAYTIFANSSSTKDLYSLMVALDRRSPEYLELNTRR